MSKARELAELSRTVADSADAVAITVDSNENTTFTGVVTANAGVVVDNITIDGTTLALSSGDLTLDVAGDIVLDADGGDFKFRDGGAGFFTISNSSLDAVLKVEQSNEDFIIKGNDGGSEITALTLDMSDGGTASFNSHIRLGDNKTASFGAGFDIEITSDGTNGTIGAPNGDLTLDVAGNINLDADGGEFRFKDGGTLYATAYQGGGGSFYLASAVQDKDLIFQGNDGGTTITALTLDMSAAGNATFSGNVTTGASLISTNAIVDNLMVKTSSGSMLVKTNAGANIARFNNILTTDLFGSLDVTGNIIVSGTVDGVDLQTLNTTANAALPKAGGTMTGTLSLGGSTMAFDSVNDYMEFNKALFSPIGYFVGTTGTKVGHLQNSAGVMHMEAATGRQIAFGNETNGEHVRIDADGNVGIGTDDPGKLLTLSRATEAQSEQLEFRNVGGITNGNFDGIKWSQGATGGTMLAEQRVNYYSTGVVDMSFNLRNEDSVLYLKAGGNVGIGTADPASPLHVKKTGSTSAAQEFLRLENHALGGAGAGSSINFHHYHAGGGPTGGAKAASITAQNMATWPAGTPSSYSTGLTFGTLHENTFDERMRITNEGKVLIGDTASVTSDLLQIESPSSGGGGGIHIRRNDSNNDQQIGIVRFGNNSNANLASIIAKTDGSVDNGKLIFKTRPSGSGIEERMVIDSNGNVGIGTTAVTSPGLWYDENPGYLAISHWATPPTPAAMLHLSDNSNDLDVPQIRIEGRENPGDTVLDIAVKDAAVRLNLVEGSTDAGNGYGQMIFKTNAAVNTSNPTRGGFLFSTPADANNLVITNTGNVGIGTDDPDGKFVVSNGGAEGIEFFPAASSAVNTTQHYNRSGSAYVKNRTIALNHEWTNGATDPAMNLIPDGDSTFLVVKAKASTYSSTANLSLYGTNPNINGGSLVSRATIQAQTDGTAFGTKLRLFTNNASNVETRALTVDASQNVGIGTDSPLSLDGNAAPGLTVSSNGPYILLQDANNSDKVRYISNNTGELQFGIVGDNGASGKTEHMRIDTSGKVGIGTDNPSYPLHIRTNDGTTNSTVGNILITNLSTGTTVPGFGGHIQFQAERNNGVNQNIGKIAFQSEVNASTNISAGLRLYTSSAGTMTEKGRISWDGMWFVNGVRNYYQKVTLVNSSAYTFDVPIHSTGNGHTVYYECMYNHFGNDSYGARRMGFFSFRSLSNSTSADHVVHSGGNSTNAGAWSVSMVGEGTSTPKMRFTKSAGSYPGTGQGYIHVRGGLPV